MAYRAIMIRDRISREESREASVEEIAKELNVDREEIVMCLDAIQEPVSLQEPSNNDNSDNNIYLIDQISDKKNTDETWAESLTIVQMMQNLNEKEKTIINKRYFEGRTQMEIADEIGISQAQVSRLEKDAIKHMRRLYK
jgi:RNA polymerase sporulation-specific sigma factor